jgi:hypothetical protein
MTEAGATGSVLKDFGKTFTAHPNPQTYTHVFARSFSIIANVT